MRGKRVLTAGLCTLLALATICAFFSMLHTSCASQVIQVPQDYPTIHEAIDAASAGDTIQVNRRAGEAQSVYYERLVIDKQLTLVGESRETIIIDGSAAGTVMRVQADSVEIRGFTIRNAGRKYSGIRANGYSYVTVANNTLETNKKGIVLLYSYYNTVVHNILVNNGAEGISLSESIGNNVSDNDVSESAYGIKLSSTNTTFVVHNTVANNSYGIYLDHSSNDTIRGNTLLRNSVDGVLPYKCTDVVISHNDVSESAYGIELHSSDSITVLGNNATANSYGIYLAYSGPVNTLENNTIADGDWGITLYNSSSNTLKGNTLSYNTYGVDPATESNNNLFYHNNFIENIEQAVWNPDCINTWDNGYPSGGNYWSDYTGTDADDDDIGDTPYTIDPNNRDRYPLMNPWGIVYVHDVAIVAVSPEVTMICRGFALKVNITATNEGDTTETFSVSAYANSTLIGQQIITDLQPDATTTLIFNWDTTDAILGNYTISATAETVPDETDVADNALVDGTVKVRYPGDVNEDGVVDLDDMYIVAVAFGTTPGMPRWDPRADLAPTYGFIDLVDLYVVACHFGETY